MSANRYLYGDSSRDIIDHIFLDIFMCDKETVEKLKANKIRRLRTFLDADPHDYEMSNVIKRAETKQWLLFQKLVKIRGWKTIQIEVFTADEWDEVDPDEVERDYELLLAKPDKTETSHPINDPTNEPTNEPTNDPFTSPDLTKPIVITHLYDEETVQSTTTSTSTTTKLSSPSNTNKKEREFFFSDDENELVFFDSVLSGVEGARCSVCNTTECCPLDLQTKNASEKSGDIDREKKVLPKSALRLCSKCKAIFHLECVLQDDRQPSKSGEFLCDGCMYVNEEEGKEGFEKPQCHMCNQSDGVLLKASAAASSQKRWRNLTRAAFNKSLFGKQIWCHAICGMWNPSVYKIENGPSWLPYVQEKEKNVLECSAVIMSDGKTHTNSKIPCFLCGYFTGAKVVCEEKTCLDDSHKSRNRRRYHVTCARQAGLEVSRTLFKTKATCFTLRCYKHKKCEYALRAKLEDFIEFERTRAGPQLENRNTKMKLEHAGALLHQAISILGCLGWAWRWAEWWVWFGDTWEPLLEEDQDESMMTDEELLRVPSDRESRCTDARKCRLAALGAALRNRDFDDHDDGDRMILDKALRAVLNTPSLVGPWKKSEIDFFADWLGRAYRSRSPLLGFGEDKIPVFEYGRSLHIKDSSKKFELGCRTLPGKEQKEGEIFDFNHANEIDDFLIPEALDDPPVYQQPRKYRKRERVHQSSAGQLDQDKLPSSTDKLRRSKRTHNVHHSLFVSGELSLDEMQYLSQQKNT